MTHTIYLASGSNLGDRLANLHAAEEALAPSVRLIKSSPIYETPPWGYLDQPSFLNQVLAAKTDLQPGELLAFLKRLEIQLGRQTTFHYGPRLIDLDIIFYDDIVLVTPELTIPHPRLGERAFVLVPLADLAPEMRHPITGLTVAGMLSEVDSTDIQIFGKGTPDTHSENTIEDGKDKQ